LACKEGYSWNSIFKRVFHPNNDSSRGSFQISPIEASHRGPRRVIFQAFRAFCRDERYHPSPEYPGFDSTSREKITEKKLLIGQKAADTLKLYSIYNERLKTLFVRLEGSMDREGAKELVKRLRGVLDVKIQKSSLTLRMLEHFPQRRLPCSPERVFCKQKKEGSGSL